MADGYVRTRIKRLKVSGYRSLYSVELSDLPDIVVFHGKNGTGKSNLMAVPGMVLRWVGAVGFPSPEEPSSYTHQQAAQSLGLRSSDFICGREPTLRIELELELGTVASRPINRVIDPLGCFHVSIVAQDFDDRIRVWCEDATLDGVSLAVTPSALRLRLQETLEAQTLLLHYPAYRIGHESSKQVEGSLSNTFQSRMFAVHIDTDIGRHRQLSRLGHLLGTTGAFPGADHVEFAPGLDQQLDEHRLLVAVPGVGDIPLENLGTGQQQLIMMTADALLEQRPIIQFEEPEAHLHKELMETFARFLRMEAELAGPESPIDQVWLSTHHHAFAIAPEYFEVTHDPEHGTMVERRDRAFATRHFYEPGPLWEALRSLANSTSHETVVMHDSDGQPITAGEILDSMTGDRQRANEFAVAATRTIVSRFRKRPVEAS